jgi:hypothetical protein
VSEPTPTTPQVSDRDRRWAAAVGDWAKTMGGAFEKIADLTQDEKKRTLLLLGDQDTIIEFAVPVGTMRACRSFLPKRQPDSAKLRDVAKLLNAACDHYAQSAVLFGRGVDRFDATLILRANKEMLKGTALTRRATKRTLEVAAG